MSSSSADKKSKHSPSLPLFEALPHLNSGGHWSWQLGGGHKSIATFDIRNWWWNHLGWNVTHCTLPTSTKLLKTV